MTTSQCDSPMQGLGICVAAIQDACHLNIPNSLIFSPSLYLNNEIWAAFWRDRIPACMLTHPRPWQCPFFSLQSRKKMIWTRVLSWYHMAMSHYGEIPSMVSGTETWQPLLFLIQMMECVRAFNGLCFPLWGWCWKAILKGSHASYKHCKQDTNYICFRVAS